MCTSILLMLTLLIFEKWTLCNAMVVHSPSFGGETEGDPAPGRSPGPPEVIAPSFNDFKIIETTILPTSETIDDCTLEGDTVDDPRGFVNISINHALFKSDWLISGITYQGKF